MYTELAAVDLFAGGGGLTVGLKRAGLRVVSAVELDNHAYTIYKVNHPEVHAYRQDICAVHGSALKDPSGCEEIAVMAACPPCQGFSSLTAKYRKDDGRNKLVLEVARLVEEVRPLTLMMENVPGLSQKGADLFNQLLDRLANIGYSAHWRVIQIADFGVPQRRRRLVLLAGRGFDVPFPAKTHDRLGRQGLPKWRTVRDALSGMCKPLTLSQARAEGGPEEHDWHVVRDISRKNVERLRVSKPGKMRADLPVELRPDCHKGSNEGFHNVYGRLEWDQPSPTITAGCTTLSKGRFGHPEEERTLSVREAAILQTFPADYAFCTPFMEPVCQVIGNALPCDFASVLAASCIEAITRWQRHQTGETTGLDRLP